MIGCVYFFLQTSAAREEESSLAGEDIDSEGIVAYKSGFRVDFFDDVAFVKDVGIDVSASEFVEVGDVGL